MNKRLTLTVVLVMVLSLWLSACGGSQGGGGAAAGDNDANRSNEGKSEGITLRVMDWKDSTRDIREEFHKHFMEKYPEVTEIEYTTLTQDQFRDTILAAIRTNEAPDIFMVPHGYKLPTLVEDGWYQPLSPYVDDDFFENFVDGMLVEGVNVIDGQVYAIPDYQPQVSTLVFYNKDLFRKAGLDPEKPPTTYEEFREYARKITEAGNGEFYGFIEGGKQTNRWNFTIQDWSSLAGSGLGDDSPVSKLTGKAPYHTEAVTNIFDLFAGMADDGSIHPQTSSISAPEARQMFANGEAGFIVQGVWNVGVWDKNNPDLDYGVMAPPMPEGGRKGAMQLSLSPGLGISANTEYPELAAKYIEEYYIGGFMQEEAVKMKDNFSVVEGLTEQYSSNQFLDFYELNKEYGVIGPIPEAINPDVIQVFAEYKYVSPTAGDILQGVAIAGVRDYKPMLEELSNKTDAALANAIEAAKEKGANVSIEDFTFADWDPMTNYTK